MVSPSNNSVLLWPFVQLKLLAPGREPRLLVYMPLMFALVLGYCVQNKRVSPKQSCRLGPLRV